jgi:CHASE2 domain-containing sensor protein
LWFQPYRFTATPAYAYLLDLLPQQAWALLYAAVAILLIAATMYRDKGVLNLVVHTASITLLLVWWAVFVVRWLTDSHTTDVNLLSWGAYLYLAVRSAWLTSRHVVASVK